MRSSWEENSKFILESLKRIEDKLDMHSSMMQDHFEKDVKDFEKVNIKMEKISTNLSWHTRIGSAVIGCLSAVVGWKIHHG